jgi:UDP-GlcNAc:undecaprenyl-phosphate GlcNAc-1-phosphate transferase
VIYVAATMVVFYWQTTNVRYTGPYSFENVFFLILAASIIIGYRFARQRQFTVTPTDFLVIFLAIIAPGLLSSVIAQSNLMAIGAKTIVLFYSIEMLISRSAGRELSIRGVVVAILTLLTVKAGIVPLSA